MLGSENVSAIEADMAIEYVERGPRQEAAANQNHKADPKLNAKQDALSESLAGSPATAALPSCRPRFGRRAGTGAPDTSRKPGYHDRHQRQRAVMRGSLCRLKARGKPKFGQQHKQCAQTCRYLAAHPANPPASANRPVSVNTCAAIVWARRRAPCEWQFRAAGAPHAGQAKMRYSCRPAP